MSQKIQVRRGTEVQRQNTTFDQGEPIWIVDTKQLYMGDGVTVGGISVSGGSGAGNLSLSGVVYTFGNQTISGTKTFPQDMVLSRIRPENLNAQGLDIRVNEGKIYSFWGDGEGGSASEYPYIDVFNAKMGDETWDTLDWRNCILYREYDGGPQSSIKWSSYQLWNIIDDGESYANFLSLDWGQKILSGNWNTNTSPTLGTHIVNKSYLDTRLVGVGGGVNVVHTTGNQTISGVKAFDEPIVASFIQAPAGDISLRLIDSNIGPTSSTTPIISFAGGSYFLATGSIEDNTQISLDWGARKLIDSRGSALSRNSVSLDWENRILSGNWTAQSLDILSGFTNSEGDVTIIINNSTLVDNVGGTAVSWNQRILFDELDIPALDWNNRILSGNWTMSGRSVDGIMPSVNGGTSSNINWNSGDIFYKTLTQNTTFTFSNARDGQTQIAQIINTGTANYTSTWPGYVRWSDNAPPVQSVGTGIGTGVADIYTFIKIATGYYGNTVRRFVYNLS